jgi:competence protein ComEC
LERPRRAPAVPAAIAVAAGLCASRAWPGGFVAWWATALVSAASWLVLRRLGQERLSVAALLAGWGALAAAWHDVGWSWVAPRDVSRVATEQGVPVRLVAKVLEPAWIVVHDAEAAPPWQPPERTLTTLDCRELLVGGGREAVSGRVRLSLSGHYPELTCGDVVAVVGTLRLPFEPLNPGDFDYRTWLRGQGVRAVLTAGSAECVLRLARESTVFDVWGRVRQALRREARGLFLSRLSPETAPVAETLLLGGRRRLDDDLRQAFVESGMLHVLAISGVNVALLGLWITILCRTFGYSSPTSLLTAMIGLVIYAAVTDGDPPVVRATVMGLIGAAALWSGRPASGVQVVAMALLGMLLVHPPDLFDAGAQLSFLSVLTIGEALSAWQRRGDADVASRQQTSWLSGSWRLWMECSFVGLGIWLATAPLVAWRFQFVSPIGVVLNVLLSPVIVVLMWAGYSFLIVGLAVPLAAAPLGMVLDFCLFTLIRSVTWASSLQFGHVDIASPPAWWMIGYYLGAGWLLVWGHAARTRMIAARVLLAWLVVGFGAGLVPDRAQGLSCRFLAVGHGLSVLLEFPDGKTLLYDAGGMGDPRRTARIIMNELRRRGHRRIDAVILSHADADHCNALPHLIGEIPIGVLLIGPGFLNDDQRLAVEIVDRCAAAKIPVGFVAAGHRLAVHPEVEVCILHPSREFASGKDNSYSVVVAVDYRGRRILLTGDVEAEGLAELLQQPARDCDVLLSPHHGSRGANPERLARWSTPEWVVVSARDAETETRLSGCYGPSAEILATARRGAIEFRITPRGELQVETFRAARGGPTIERQRPPRA